MSVPSHYQHWPSRIPFDLPPAETTLWDNLEITAHRYPAKVAIEFFGRSMSFVELRQQCERLAGFLQLHSGVERGDRVLVMMQNSPQFVIACYAIMRCGAVIVPVNPMTKAAELPHYIGDSGAKVAIGSADTAIEIFAAQQSLDESERLRCVIVGRYRDYVGESVQLGFELPPAWATWLDATAELPSYAVDWETTIEPNQAPQPYGGQPDDLVTLGYTSGTTGKPKACMHSHRTIGHNVIAGALWNGITMGDLCFGVTPMFHVTGMLYGMHAPIYAGATTVILPRWDREVAGRLISAYGVTNWINIPTMIIDLLGSPNIDEFDLSSLRSIGGGGSSMPEAVARRLEEQYGLVYREGYGLTETAAPSHSNPLQRPKRQCLGIPIIGTESLVIDPETRAEVPTGETGEIVIHGPQVFKGYWNNPEATAAAFIEIDGKQFFRSGDLGYVDDEGYFFITDRLKRMINASGFKVWPAEVESMLYQHPDIQEVCVVSARDPYRGETVKAVVVSREASNGQLTADAIETWARKKMAAYKVPRIIEFVDSLPKSGSGKVMWRLLQEQES